MRHLPSKVASWELVAIQSSRPLHSYEIRSECSNDPKEAYLGGPGIYSLGFGDPCYATEIKTEGIADSILGTSVPNLTSLTSSGSKAVLHSTQN